MNQQSKTIFYKIYDVNNVLIVDENWDDASFQSFSKKINGGFGECRINLARRFDDFGENYDVQLNNKIEIYVYDEDVKLSSSSIHRTGKRIYCGYISNYQPWIDENGNQGVVVILLGHHTKLSCDILKNGTQTMLYTKATVGLTTTALDIAAADGGHIMRAIMARYVAENSNSILHYNTGTIDNTSSNIKFTFDAETYLNAIERVRQMSPAGWYWYIDSDNLFHFKLKSTSLTHTFYYGVNFNKISVNKNMEKIINTVLLDDGSIGTLYREYKNENSQNQYGRKILQKSEKWYSDTDTMDSEAANILDTMNAQDIEINLTLFDNNINDIGYDLESIEVGDTVKIEGFNNSTRDVLNNSLFEEYMVIKEFTYRIDRMDLVIQPVKIGLFDKILTMKRDVGMNASSRGETYTEA